MAYSIDYGTQIEVEAKFFDVETRGTNIKQVMGKRENNISITDYKNRETNAIWPKLEDGTHKHVRTKSPLDSDKDQLTSRFRTVENQLERTGAA